MPTSDPAPPDVDVYPSGRDLPDAGSTHCPYCAFQCGMIVRAQRALDGSQSIEVRGDESFPVNRGQLCIKGFTSAALLDHAERVTTPLLRGADGGWLSADWPTALDFTAERLLQIRRDHGAEALAAFGSGSLTNEKAYLLGKFARVALGTPHIDYNGRYCMSSAAAAQNQAFGVDRGLPFPVSDIAQTRALLLWGSNCAETLPPIVQWIQAQRAAGGKLIVVDPRLTDTARNAQLHLQLAPGSDLALANGLLHIAIAENWIDREYIARRTTGFDALRRKLLAYDPARVERMTGVAADKLRQAAHWLAASPSSMLLSGRGPEQQSKGVDTVLAFINLMLALGKVGVPNSGYGCLTGQGNGQGGREHGQKADQLPGYRSVVDPADRAAIAEIWGVAPESLPGQGRSAFELLDSLGPEGIRGLVVLGSNLAVASPDAQRVDQRLRALELLVVCDAFLNETTEHAHVVLPTLQWAEEDGTITNLEGRVLRRRRTVTPPAGARSDLEILCELAARLGAAEHFESASPRHVFDELRRATAGARADYSGITYEKIDRQGGVFWPCPALDHPGTERPLAERFAHADGRARFHVVEHRPAGEEPDAEYPLYFTTGRYKEHYNSGAQTRRVAKLNDAHAEPRVELHPQLAARLGVSDGSYLLVESRRGRVEFRVAVRSQIRPDTLFAPFHWGGAQAANLLTNAALDPTSGMPEFKLCAVRASAASGSTDVPGDVQ